MALEGFDRLLERGRGVLTTVADGRAALEALADGFLEFQHSEPRLLELMYESELTRPTIDDRIAGQQREGFALVADAIAAAAPALDREEVERRAVVYWSSIYGFASLLGKDLLSPFVDSHGRRLSD